MKRELPNPENYLACREFLHVQTALHHRLHEKMQKALEASGERDFELKMVALSSDLRHPAFHLLHEYRLSERLLDEAEKRFKAAQDIVLQRQADLAQKEVQRDLAGICE